MNYIEAPNALPDGDKSTSVFLAGSISGCPDWQSYVVDKIKDLDITILNPRRAVFDMGDPEASKIQIEWEFNHLRKASFIAWWFSKETVAPIGLFELGQHARTKHVIVVGMDPEYPRKIDVEMQMSHNRPRMPLYYSLDDLVTQIRDKFTFLYGLKASDAQLKENNGN